ncbi:hypothetical protein [Phaeospirillum tilakii]|uniref:Uncharacterized protein n=1 Tax=Phaeospirillum tilakii TaxID=741673 RepID=A0ABW5CBM9_9PROT
MRIEPIPEHLVFTVSMILALNGLNLFTAPASAIENAVQRAESMIRAGRSC